MVRNDAKVIALVSLKKNYLYSVASQIILFFVPLILVPYTSRTLGPENLGIYSYTYSITYVFSTLGRLGFNTYGKLQIAQNRDDSERRNTIFCELMTLKLILTTVEIVLYIAFVFAAIEYRRIGLIMTIYFLADGVDISWLYEGIENYKLLAIRRFIVNILNLSMVLALVRGGDDLYLYTFIMQGTVLATNLTLWVGLHRHVTRLRLLLNTHTLYHLRHCFVYFLPAIADLIYNMLDKVMLGFIGASAVESGYYEQSYKIISTVQVVILQMGAVTLPRLTYLHGAGRDEEFHTIVRRTQRLNLMLLIPMTVGLYTNADLIVMTVLGESFLGSVGVFRVLSVLLLFGALNYNIGNQTLVATGRQKQYNIGVFAGACVNFTLNLLLIGRYYAIGAAVGSLITEIVIYTIFIAFSKKVVGISALFPRSVVKYIIAVVLMVICNTFLKACLVQIPSVIRLIAIILVCAVTYFAVLLCMKEEILVQLFAFAKRNILTGSRKWKTDEDKG